MIEKVIWSLIFAVMAAGIAYILYVIIASLYVAAL